MVHAVAHWPELRSLNVAGCGLITPAVVSYTHALAYAHIPAYAYKRTYAYAHLRTFTHSLA